MKQPHFYKLLGAFALFMLFSMSSYGQGTTTSSMAGLIVDTNGEEIIGGNVVAVHEPTGTSYGTVTRIDGQFIMPNMRIGGPYTVTISYVGYDDVVKNNIYLKLGQESRQNFTLGEQAVDLTDVVVTAVRRPAGERTGAETSLGEYEISTLPTISRDLTDFTRFTPQSTLTEDGDGELGFSVAGQNNRFNSVFIDGAISNDVFGLTDQGTNGGQAGVSPISLDAIEEFQIVIAPYDVTLGGFTGGGVNAVTRSGTNKFKGSVYWLTKNEGLAGKTPTDNPDIDREKLPDFSSNTYGFRVGGPIVKNKVFFFLNTEFEKRNTPLPAPFQVNGDELVGYDGDATLSQLNALDTKLNEFGYDAGGFLNNEKKVDGFKILGKLDFNLSRDHKLSVRHSYSKGEAEKVNPSGTRNINYNNSYEYFPSITNSTAIELNSVFGTTMANNLTIGYTSVRDDRDPLGTPFPRVGITDGAGFITFGSEAFSTANTLEQDNLTITDNLKLYQGRHTITVGTHIEFFKVLNLFVRQNFGQYSYDSLDDFLNNGQPSLYQRGYSLVDGRAVGDNISNAAANFKAMQIGFYVQDEFRLNSRVKLTGGLRLDIPSFLDDPPVDANFNNVAVPAIEAFYNLDGARAGQMPSTQLMISPRFGFNIDVKGDQTTQIRGGAGIFTGRLPLVWAGGSHTNNGLTVGGVFEFNPTIVNSDGTTTPMTFVADIESQPTATDFGDVDPVPSGQMDLFVKDLKFPQVLRASLAVDQQLPWGLTGTLEGLFTKNINSIVYQNVNVKPAVGMLVGGPDNRPIFDRRDEVDDTYGRILLGRNTSEGYSASITASLTKAFSNGLAGTLAYTYSYAEGLNDLTSSQNSSQWRNMEVGPYGKNDLQVTRSDFSAGSRLLLAVSYRHEWIDQLATTISLFYNGQSGEVFSYTYTGRNADRLTSQDSRDFTDLIYIPASASDINLVDYDDGGVTVTAAEQWSALDAFISQDDYLSENRGKYSERNGARTPFTSIVDLRLAQEVSIAAGGRDHKFEITFDVFNFSNMLNKDWGRRYRSFFNGVGLITVDGVSDDVQTDGTIHRTPNYTFRRDAGETSKEILNIDDTGTLSSRWQAQLGLRYTF